MELWIGITIVSAFLQNLRSTLQKHLKSRMGTTGATFVRFGFGLPFAFLYLAILYIGQGRPLPSANAEFLWWAVIGASSQIGATVLLVQLFSYRNFAVGSAYSKTEAAQAAIFALLLVGETITPGVVIAILISVAGVMLISVARTHVTPVALLASVVSPPALLGIGSGMLFGISSVAYRSASLSLGQSLVEPDALMQAACTLVVVITMQTVSMLAWIAWRDRQELVRIAAAWKTSAMVGFVGATASFGWFTAMTIQQAAVVKALAQVEMLFSFASAVFFFREKINRMEISGCLLIVLGIFALLVAK